MKFFKPNSFFYFLSVFLFFSFQDISEIRGRVISISDGDTITILNSENQQIKIRLEGIDCPESGQDFGRRARQLTSTLTYDKYVTVTVKGTDKYERILGVVKLEDGTNVNKELLKAGLAWHFKRFNSEQELADFETQAKSQNIGLWSMANPIAPWDYRDNPSLYQPQRTNRQLTIGQTETICDIPAQVVNRNNNIYINYGGNYPNHTMSAIIQSRNLSKFPSDILTILNTNEFCIEGIISIHKDKPQINIERPDQIILN